MFVVGLLFEKCSVKNSVRSENCNTINCKTIFSSNKLKFCVLVGNLDDDKSTIHGHEEEYMKTARVRDRL